jgi:transposase InsO family protein
VLVEVSVVEQRYDAVKEVLADGAQVAEVARRYGVARQTVHRWIARYRGGGLGALADRSHRPKGCPHQMPAAIEARVLEIRRVHDEWGPIRIRHALAREEVSPLPGRSSIYRALLRAGMIEARRRRRRKADYRRWERPASMELWQLDVMGRVFLADGTELKVVTGIDDHSRFCVLATLVPRATARRVCAAFAEAIRRYGVPEEVLTDNGKVFTARFGHRAAETLFDRICRENGITHRLTAVRSPTTTGKIERFHKTLRRELFAKHSFTTIEEASRRSTPSSRTTTPFGRTSPLASGPRPSGSGCAPWRRPNSRPWSPPSPSSMPRRRRRPLATCDRTGTCERSTATAGSSSPEPGTAWRGSSPASTSSSGSRETSSASSTAMRSSGLTPGAIPWRRRR